MNVHIKLSVYKRAVLLGIDEKLPELVSRLLMSYMDELEESKKSE